MVGLLLGAFVELAGAMTIEDRVELADGLYARGLYDLAAREYASIATNEPAPANLDVVLFRLAESHRHRGEIDPALAAYKLVFETIADSSYAVRAEYRHAEIYATTGRCAEAAALFDAFVAKNPPPEFAAPALYKIGTCRAKLDQHAAAEDAFRRVLTSYGDTTMAPYAGLALADLLKGRKGKDQEVIDLYRHAARKGDSPRVAAEAWFQLARFTFDKGDFAKSAEAYEQLLMRYPDDERAEPARLQAAWAFYHTKRHADALKISDGALPRASGSQRAEWLYVRANVLRELGRADEAQQAYDELLAGSPEPRLVAAASFESAALSFAARDYSNVVARLSGYTATNDTMDDALWMRGEAQSALGASAEALRAFTDLTTQFPESSLVPGAQFRRGKLLAGTGDHAAAIAAYRAVVAAAPKDELAPYALHAAADLLLADRDDAGALDVLARVAAEYPDYKAIDKVLYDKARAELKLGKEDEGRATLELLVESKSVSSLAAEAYYLIGTLREKAGMAEVAEFNYRKALLKKPGVKMQPEIQLRLAAVLQAQGKQDEAVDLLNPLLTNDVASALPATLLDWLARKNLEKGLNESAAIAARAIRSAGATPAAIQIAWTLEGRAEQASGRLEQARKAFEAALAVPADTREGIEAALYLGDVELQEGRGAEALPHYARAADMAKGDETMDIRARSYYGMGRAAEATSDWENASRYFMSVAVLFDDPELAPESLYRAAHAFSQSGRSAEAASALKELSDRYPDSTWNRKQVQE